MCGNNFKSLKLLVLFPVQVLESQERPRLELLPEIAIHKHTPFPYFCILINLELLDDHIIIFFWSVLSCTVHNGNGLRKSYLYNEKCCFCGICALFAFDAGLCVGNFDNYSFLASIFLLIQYLAMLIHMNKNTQANIRQFHSYTLTPVFLCQVYRCMCWYLPPTFLLESDKLLHRFFFWSYAKILHSTKKIELLSVFHGHLTSTKESYLLL